MTGPLYLHELFTLSCWNKNKITKTYAVGNSMEKLGIFHLGHDFSQRVMIF